VFYTEHDCRDAEPCRLARQVKQLDTVHGLSGMGGSLSQVVEGIEDLLTSPQPSV
jgi:hypothetical protein